jgi:hypothetical protein
MGFAVVAREVNDVKRVYGDAIPLVCGGSRDVRIDPIDDIAVSAFHSPRISCYTIYEWLNTHRTNSQRQ